MPLRIITLLISVTLAAPLLAAEQDCPPFDALPKYAAGDAAVRPYAEADFKSVTAGGELKTTQAKGRRCISHYAPQDRTRGADASVQKAYRAQLQKLGAKISYLDDQNTFAHLFRDGKDIWLHAASGKNGIDLTVVENGPLPIVISPPSGKDEHLFGHMPGYEPSDPRERDAADEIFKVWDGAGSREVKVQGRLHALTYRLAPKATVLADLEIQGNYRDALTNLGAEIVFSDAQNTTARLIDKGRAIWIKVFSQETEIDVTAVEEKPFEASVSILKPEALKSALDTAGHVVLYLDFDFGKAALKPDVQPVIDQVAALLKANPDLKLSIEAHTDTIGEASFNKSRSAERATAIVVALVSAGISASRLSSNGFGAERPIASNDTSDGRAKNRRVELVRK